MRTLIHVLILGAMLFVFVQPGTQPISGGTKQEEHRFHASSDRVAADIGTDTAGDEGWKIECIVCSKQLGGMSERSLQLDDQGYPHIAYGGEDLFYAWHDGTK